ncbi:unnamed protein product [Bursaphelenchus xylophilus]|uniref:(pine wood nematode) hypothetical protein n=1 Tax=Bursaphelenchus xylophilus TaxID=6326 RepID=A0A811M4S3_BURXY|nr:unnamed protein product [Bursaphelenchus xylophilus]CAG9129767.1 unnamed protein product [Bursaphelenchus xylophilus]
MSSYFDILRGEKAKKVRFFNVLSGYLNSENICFDLQYRCNHIVKEKDWIGVFPAGFRKPNLDFAAIKMAPPQKSGKKSKSYSEMHKIVFKSAECKLAPRNFYQIAYINSSGKSVATSAIFYIESGHMPKQAVIIQNQPEPGILSHLLCSTNSASWTENTASMALSDDSGMEDENLSSESRNWSQEHEDDEEGDQFDENSQLLPLTGDQGAFSSLTKFFSDLWHSSVTAPPDRSSSMYEIGATPSTSNGFPDMAHEHYQKLIGQLTRSNANLMRENDSMARRLMQLEQLLRDHVEHLNSVYYTLFRNGYSSLEFPDGQEVHLSQFRGVLLNFAKSGQAKPHLAKNSRERQHLSEKTSDFSSDSSASSTSVDQEELRATMIKCITRPKYDDLDEFVNWLKQDKADIRNAEAQRKAHSLEERVQESLRLRTPLQRSSRIDELPPSRARSDSELRAATSLSVSPCPPASVQPSTPPDRSPPQVVTPTRNSISNGNNKNKTARLRTQSLGGGKINFLGGRRTSSQRTSQDSSRPAPRKSLANLASLRLNTHHSPRQPQRNLI